MAPYSELQVTDTDMPGLMSKPRTFLMNCTQFGLNFMVLLLSVVAVTFVASPVIGMVSDRLRNRVGLIGMAFSAPTLIM
nr:hypothetical protein BaRGS_028917 [Batillaria attramentaria]